VKVTIEIDDELIADVLDQGSLYGIAEWGDCDVSYEYILKVLRTDGLGMPLNEVERAWIGGTIHEDKLVACHVLFHQDIADGLRLMSGLYHEHFCDILSGDYDCITGDVLFQLSAFGEMVYG
jgi:hypothetical protein